MTVTLWNIRFPKVWLQKFHVARCLTTYIVKVRVGLILFEVIVFSCRKSSCTKRGPFIIEKRKDLVLQGNILMQCIPMRNVLSLTARLFNSELHFRSWNAHSQCLFDQTGSSHGEISPTRTELCKSEIICRSLNLLLNIYDW